MAFLFLERLRKAPAPLIAEIKPSSPKVGDLLKTVTVNEIAEDYAKAGAPCLSVTTGKWHKGHLDMITQMAETGLPVLRKDFIISRRHLHDTVHAGGSAVLLTCALMRKIEIQRLADEALALGLTPFVEAASVHELEGLDLPNKAILAINNRDIREKEMDNGGVSRSLELYDQARKSHLGLLVSASGMLEPKNVAFAIKGGFDGVLVGTALLSDPLGPYETVRKFMLSAQKKELCSI